MSLYFRGHDRPQSHRKEQRSARCHRFDAELLLRPALMLSQLNIIDATHRISPDRLDTSKCNLTPNLGRSCRYCKMRLTSRLYLERLVMVPALVALPPPNATTVFTAVKLT